MSAAPTRVIFMQTHEAIYQCEVGNIMTRTILKKNVVNTKLTSINVGLCHGDEEKEREHKRQIKEHGSSLGHFPTTLESLVDEVLNFVFSELC